MTISLNDDSNQTGVHELLLGDTNWQKRFGNEWVAATAAFCDAIPPARIQ